MNPLNDSPRPSTIQIHRLAPELLVVEWGDHETSYLLVHQGQSLLVDCHRKDLSGMIGSTEWPQPTLILHTHIQPEHCREGQTFSGAVISVHEPDMTLASAPDTVRSLVQEQKADLAQWETMMGRETYSIAGWQNRFPPQPALAVGTTFRIGERLPFGQWNLEVIALPAHTTNAVGFLLRAANGDALALFCGDLMRRGACLPDFHSLAESYGKTRLDKLPELLRQTAAFGAVPWFPSSGPSIPDGRQEAIELAQKIEAFQKAQTWNPLPRPGPRQEPVSFGRYWQHAEGIYQIRNYGNIILLVHPDGHGLMVDPGPCDFENPGREEELLRDLEQFEREKGLRKIDLILLTHFHGDHIDCTDLVRSRYPGCQVATWAPVAEVVEHPENFPYCARLPWYGLEKKNVRIDLRLNRHQSLDWHGHAVRTLHLPGHALIHAGYLVEFQGQRLALTGDSVQSNGEAEKLDALVGNHSVPDILGGCIQAYTTLAQYQVDLSLGGHSSWFTNTANVYHASLARMAYALPRLRNLVPKGDLQAAFVPGDFPIWTDQDLS